MLTQDKHEWLGKCLSTYHSIGQVALAINHVTKSFPCTPEEIAAVYAIEALTTEERQELPTEAIEYHLDQLIVAKAYFDYWHAKGLVISYLSRNL